MKYSIIVPCYNTASTLEKTIHSIQDCGLSDYEILLVDDGSKDETGTLCDRLAGSGGAISCIHKENGGVSSARNLGLQEAAGEYVWFFDSDDLVDPGSMKRAEQIIDEYAPDMLMFGMSFDYYRGKRLYQRLELYYDREKLLSPEELSSAFSELYHDNMLTPCWNKLIRRSVLNEHRIRFREDMFVMEDFLFSLEALRQCRTVYTLPQVIYRYYQGSGSDGSRAASRLKRIEDLCSYAEPFEKELSDHGEIMKDMFFGLLRQKLSAESAEEMSRTAKTVLSSSYAIGEYRSKGDESLIRGLQEERFDDLFKEFRRNKRRASAVRFVKQSYLYSLVKGVVIKRVKW